MILKRSNLRELKYPRRLGTATNSGFTSISRFKIVFDQSRSTRLASLQRKRTCSLNSTIMLLPSQRSRLYWTILLLVIVGCISTRIYPFHRSSRRTTSARREEIARLLTQRETNDSWPPVTSTSASGTWDDVALTKAFGLPEFKSRVFPFFYRHEGVFEQDELTMTVFITPNRFDRLVDLVTAYEGMFPSSL